MRSRIWMGMLVISCVLVLALPAFGEPQLTAGQLKQVLAVLESDVGKQIQPNAGAADVGRLLDKVAAIGPPDMPVVKKLAQMKSQPDGQTAYGNNSQLAVIEKAVMRRVFGAALAARTEALSRLSTAEKRRIYAFGDVGSWDTLIKRGSPQYSTDMDFTLFSEGGGEAFETRFQESFRTKLKVTSSSVLPESCGVVVTRPGHEGGAGVFVTRAGIEWVHQSVMKFKRIKPDGTVGRQVPFDDLKLYAFDTALAVDPDLAPFLEKGRIADMDESSERFQRFVDVIVKKYPNLGVDKLTAGKATGGVGDMMVHNYHEAIRAAELGWDGRAARSTKYGLRGSEIFRRGLAEAKDGRAKWFRLLGSENQKLMGQLFELDKVRQDQRAFNKLFTRHFGAPTEQAMKAYTKKVQGLLTQQSRITHTYHMKQIVGIDGVEGKAARSNLLQSALDDYRKVEAEMVRYGAPEEDLKHQRSLIQEAEAVRLMNDGGELLLLDNLRALYDETSPRQRRGLLDFLRKTPKGSELGEIMKPYLDEDSRKAIKARLLNEGAVLDYVKSVVFNPALERAAKVKDRVELGVEGIQFTLACAKAYVEADLTKGSREWQTAQAIAREAAMRRWPLLAIGLSAYAAAQQGDLPQLLKLLAMYLCPWSAIPETVKGLGLMGQDIAITVAFEGLLDSLYARSTFDPDLDEANRLWGTAVDVLNKAQFRFVSVKAMGSDYEGKDGLTQLIEDMLIEGGIADSWKPMDAGNELAAGWARIWNRGTVHAIRTLLRTGQHTLFKGDAGMAALLKQLTENEKELRRYEKMPLISKWLGPVTPYGYDMRFTDDRTRVSNWGSLPRGSTEERILKEELDKRKEIKTAAQKRLTALIIASFQSRRRVDFIQRAPGQNVDSALEERLEKLAAVLHLDAETLVKAARKAYNDVAASLADDRKDKAAVVVDHWVNAYESIVAIKKQVIELFLKSGVPAGVLQGGAGPLSQGPPFVLKPEPDIAFAKKALSDAKHVAGSVFELYNRILGVRGLKRPEDPRAFKALKKQRYRILILEQWFAGIDGINWPLWRKLEGTVFTDAAFTKLILDDATRTRSWWDVVSSAPANRPLFVEDLREKLTAFNRTVNELRLSGQAAVTLQPAPLVLGSDGKGKLTLIPKHEAASFQWRLMKEVPGLTFTPARGRVTKGETVEINVQASPGAGEGVRKVKLRLLPTLVSEHPDVQWVKRDRAVSFIVSVGPPPPRPVKVRVVLSKTMDKPEAPLGGAEVELIGEKRSAKLKETPNKGIYASPSVFPGHYKITVKSKGHEAVEDSVDIAAAPPKTNQVDHTVTVKAAAAKPPPEPSPVELVVRTLDWLADGSTKPYRGAFKLECHRNGKLVAALDGTAGEATLKVKPGRFNLRVTAKGRREWRDVVDVKGRTVLRAELKRDLAVELPPEKTVLFKVSPTTLTLQPGGQASLSASAMKMAGAVTIPMNLSASDVLWVSSNPAVVTVASDGTTVLAIATKQTGRARLTATYGKGPDIRSAHCDVTVAVRPMMDFQIVIEPNQRRFQVGEMITFTAQSPMQPSPTWQWFFGSEEGQGQEVKRSFKEPGTYTIRLLATDPVSGTTDAVGRSITIEGQTPPPEDGGGKAGGDGSQSGSGATDGGGSAGGQPLANRRNEFKLIAGKDGKATHVEGRGWRDMAMKWSTWRKEQSLPKNDEAVLTVGDQAEGCNAGWLVFSPAKSGRLKFHVLGYHFGKLASTTTHQGEVDLRGKRFQPGTLRVVRTAGRLAEFECYMTDGTLCRVRIWRIPSVSNANVSLKRGVEILEWIPPRPGGGGGGAKKASVAALDLGALGVRLFEDLGWLGSVIGTPEAQMTRGGQPSRPFEYTLIKVSGRDTKGATAKLHIFKMKNEMDAVDFVAIRQGRYQPSSGGNVMRVRLMGWPAFYGASPPTSAPHWEHVVGWAHGDVFFQLTLRRKKVTENIQDWASQLHSMIVFAREGNLPGFDSPPANGPRIERLTYKSTVWPVRLQDGVLEIQGCGYRTYPWRSNWITLSTHAKDFRGGASAQGPVVAFTEDGKRWKVVELNFRTGKKTNEKSFDKPVSIVRGASRGCVIESGGRHYDFSQGQLREVSPKTGNYLKR